MGILAFLTDPPTIEANLLHLELPHRPPPLAPARAPPLRKELAEQGIVLEDSAPGTRWKVIRRVEEAGNRG